MGPTHEDQGCFQIVVVFLEEILVVLLSQLVVVLVELGSVILLITEQLVLCLPPRSLSDIPVGHNKNLTRPPVPGSVFDFPPPPACLEGPDCDK